MDIMLESIKRNSETDMKKIILILVILILILLALTFYQKSKVVDNAGIKIIYKDQESFLSYTKIRSKQQISFTTNNGDMVKGYDISSLVNAVDIPINGDSEYVFHSNDGGTLNLVKEENEVFYLVFQEDASGQFLRLVVPTDEFSQRWIKYLVAVEIK